MHEISAEIYTLLIYIFIAAILIRRTGGISFFFRVIMRILKLSYNNPQLKTSEKIAYDLQLFKALEGINVKNANDALLISNEINSGSIKKVILFSHLYLAILGMKGNHLISSGCLWHLLFIQLQLGWAQHGGLVISKKAIIDFR